MTLDPVQIKRVLEGMPDWQVEDGALVRGVPVAEDSREAFVEAIANVAEDAETPPEVHLQPDVVVLRIGDPAVGGVTPEDVGLASMIDQVIVGSARDQAS